jgi:hypothetical protein
MVRPQMAWSGLGFRWIEAKSVIDSIRAVPLRHGRYLAEGFILAAVARVTGTWAFRSLTTHSSRTPR